MPGRARRLPRRPSETAGALNLKEHRGRRLLTPAAAPFLKARRRAGVNAGFEICACGLGMRGAARRVNGMQGWFGRLPGRKISEGAALRCAVQLSCLEGMRWEAVADELGATGDAWRKRVERWLAAWEKAGCGGAGRSAGG